MNICVCSAVKDFNTTTAKDLELADKELYLMLSIIYQDKKYAIALRHDNSSGSLAAFDEFCDMAAFTVKHTAKKRGWVVDPFEFTAAEA